MGGGDGGGEADNASVSYRTHPLAREEFLSAIRYYTSVSGSLGERYRLAVGKHIDLIVSGLFEGPPYGGLPDVRKMLVTDFPY